MSKPKPKVFTNELASVPPGLCQQIISCHQAIKKRYKIINAIQEKKDIAEADLKYVDNPSGVALREIISYQKRIDSHNETLEILFAKKKKHIIQLDLHEQSNKERLGDLYQQLTGQELYNIIIFTFDGNIKFYNNTIQSYLDFLFNEKKFLKSQLNLVHSNLTLSHEIANRLVNIQQSINKYIKIQIFISHYNRIPNREEINELI